MNGWAPKLYRPTSVRRRKRVTRSKFRGYAPEKKPASERKGSALLMVLVITVVLSALAADLSNHSQVNLRAAANARDELQAYFHARSAIELELFVLRFQNLVKGSLGQFLPIPLFELSGVLVSSDTMKGILDRDPEAPTDEAKKDSWALGKPFGDFEGSFWIEEVVDESRKIHINNEIGQGSRNLTHQLLFAMFADEKYDKVFETMGESRDPIRNRAEIIAAISDWVDGDNNASDVVVGTQTFHGGGAEDAKYDNLPYNARYRPKDGKFHSLAELRMIPYVNDAFMRLFSKHFTVWGDNKGISMRTASNEMTAAVIAHLVGRPLLPSDRDKLNQFFQERELLKATGANIDENAFTALLTAAGFRVEQERLTQLIQQNAIYFTDVTTDYRITAIGRVNNASAKITLVWHDDRATGDIYYWREE